LRSARLGIISWKSVVYTIIIYCILLSVGCLSTASEYPKYLRTDSDFFLEIETNSPLHNATFYLPLPVKHSKPMVGNKILNVNDFDKKGYSAAFTRTPPQSYGNVSHPGELQISGNYPLYLQVSADSWPNGSYRVEIQNRSHDLPSPNFFINSLYPQGNESVILPKWDFSTQELRKKSTINPLSDLISYNSETGKQSTLIYYNYSSASDSLVIVTIHIKGTNLWLNDYDSWVTNSYDDFFYGSLRKGDSGESFINGKFIVGDGYYPDLTSSKWQQFIQRNQL
jgi:hypothetical protein